MSAKPVGAAGGDVTVTVAKVEFTFPAELLTRTQYVAAPVRGAVLRVAAVAEGTGLVVSPVKPKYH